MLLSVLDKMVRSFLCENDVKMSVDKGDVIKVTKIYVDKLS